MVEEEETFLASLWIEVIVHGPSHSGPLSGLGYSPPWWLAGYGLNFGFEIAYLCGFLAMNLKFGFDVAYLCGLLAMIWNLELGFDIAYLCGFLTIDLTSSELMTFCSKDDLEMLLLLEPSLAVELLAPLDLADFRGPTVTHSPCEACDSKVELIAPSIIEDGSW
ncbi:hypothetical protein Taro_023439, partial [Colocasia esculenta]|nr:hypothetical protein [Colocasia esculenta]